MSAAKKKSPAAPVPYGAITLTDYTYDVAACGGMTIADALFGLVSQIELDAEECDCSAPVLRVIDGEGRVVLRVARTGGLWTAAELDAAMARAHHLDREGSP